MGSVILPYHLSDLVIGASYPHGGEGVEESGAAFPKQAKNYSEQSGAVARRHLGVEVNELETHLLGE